MCLHEFVWFVAKKSVQFDVGHFMQNLRYLPHWYWHYKLILLLAGVFGFLRMTPLLNKFAHSRHIGFLSSHIRIFRLVSFYEKIHTLLQHQLLLCNSFWKLKSHVLVEARCSNLDNSFHWQYSWQIKINVPQTDGLIYFLVFVIWHLYACTIIVEENLLWCLSLKIACSFKNPTLEAIQCDALSSAASISVANCLSNTYLCLSLAERKLLLLAKRGLGMAFACFQLGLCDTIPDWASFSLAIWTRIPGPVSSLVQILAVFARVSFVLMY